MRPATLPPGRWEEGRDVPRLWRCTVVRVVRFAVLVAAGILLAYAGGRLTLAHRQMVRAAFR